MIDSPLRAAAISERTASSAFRKIVPPLAERKSYRLPLALLTPSKEPKPRIWAVPTLVIRPKSGAQTFTRRSMSSGWLAPISMTAISVSGVIESTESGTPISLFRLPTVAVTLYFVERTSRMSSLVVVLPFVPVRPMTGSLRPSGRTCSR